MENQRTNQVFRSHSPTLGLTSAPFLFIKVMRCHITFWRAQGITISVFIGDGLGSADKVQSSIHSLVVKKPLTKSGFVINTQKSFGSHTERANMARR